MSTPAPGPDDASPDFQCKVLAEDEGRYLIDVGFGYTRILDTDQHKLFGPMRGQHMKFHWYQFTGDQQAILDEARKAQRIPFDPPAGDVDPHLLNSRP